MPPQTVEAVAHQPDRKFVRITAAELREHNNKDSVWINIHGKIYDLTKWARYHPGGEKILHMLAGRDVTDPFINFHPPEVAEEKIKKFQIGEVTDYKVSKFVGEHRKLREDFIKEGLFESNRFWFVAKFTLNHAWLLLALLAPNLGFEGSLPYLISGALMGIFFQQVAFFGHDICHNAVTHNRSFDNAFAQSVGVFTGGISTSWWKATHNVHHIVTNSAEYDPDIQHLPVFAVDSKLVRTFYSFYHSRYFQWDAISRFFVSYQHYLYYPIMSVARFNLYLQSYIFLLKNPSVPGRNRELTALFLHSVWFWTFVSTFPTMTLRVAFVLICYALAGVLHVQITLSHFAEPVYHNLTYNDDSDEYWNTQVNGSLNVDCPVWMDWFHGGLQFQTEHHLFPRVPRHNLRSIQPRVEAFCKRHDIEYKKLSFFECNKKVYRTLKTAAMLARKTPSAGFSPIFTAGVNAQG